MLIGVSAQTFITDILNTVDVVIGSFVQTGYTHLVADNLTTITLLFTFYIMGLAYRFMQHTLNMDLNTVARHIVLLLIVYGLLIKWDLYSIFFFNIFTNEPGIIAKSLVNGTGMLPPGKDAAAALNVVFSQGMSAAAALLHQGSFSNVLPWLFGLAVTVMTLAFGITALLLFVYSKIAIAVILVVGPLFILFLLWNSTRGFFDKWIQTLVNFSLVPIVTSAILMLVLAIDNLILPGLTQNIDSGSPYFSGIWPYLGFCLLSALLLKQVLSICSALSGGMALEGISSALPIVNQALKTTGIKAAADKVQKYGIKKLQQIKADRADRDSRIAQTKASRN